MTVRDWIVGGVSAFVLVAGATASGVVGANAWLSRNHDAAGGITSEQGYAIAYQLEQINAHQVEIGKKLDDVHASAAETARRTLYVQQGMCSNEGPAYCGR